MYAKSNYLYKFVRELYSKRKKAPTKLGNLFYKFLLNVSYSRFALRRNDETICISTEEDTHV